MAKRLRVGDVVRMDTPYKMPRGLGDFNKGKKGFILKVHRHPKVGTYLVVKSLSGKAIAVSPDMVKPVEAKYLIRG
jgi:hypothetical protein